MPRFIAAFILLLVPFSPAFADTIAKPPPSFENPRRLVIQLNDPEEKKQTAVFNNIANLLKFYQNNVEIALVVYGPAIGITMEGSPYAERISSLSIYGVEVIACGNTLDAKKLDRKKILPDVTVATAGLAEIAERQLEGWTYLRP